MESFERLGKSIICPLPLSHHSWRSLPLNTELVRKLSSLCLHYIVNAKWRPLTIEKSAATDRINRPQCLISILCLFKLQLGRITKWFQALKIGSFWGVVNHNIVGRSHLSIGHHQHDPICYRDAFIEIRRLVGSGSWNAVIAWPLVAIWREQLRPVKHQWDWA